MSHSGKGDPNQSLTGFTTGIVNVLGRPSGFHLWPRRAVEAGKQDAVPVCSTRVTAPILARRLKHHSSSCTAHFTQTACPQVCYTCRTATGSLHSTGNTPRHVQTPWVGQGPWQAHLLTLGLGATPLLLLVSSWGLRPRSTACGGAGHEPQASFRDWFGPRCGICYRFALHALCYWATNGC